jgi:hypothetical protein
MGFELLILKNNFPHFLAKRPLSIQMETVEKCLEADMLQGILQEMRGIKER